MKTLMLTTMGLLLAGAIGGTQLQAQVHVKVGNKFELKVGDRDNRREDRKEAREDRREVRRDHKEVRRERVWVEDFKMVEERYETPGYWTTVEKKVWIAEKHVTVHEDVWVPARHENRREARRDHCGNIYYVTVCVEVPGHYECREVVKCIPGHYECVTERVYVKGECKTRMVKKVCGGHWEYRNC
ncbi:MAG: hypothetical protein IT462_06520 [Planctomycetes bacterium]|nr:hypothetical protein [Planctomycetota bacterium]